MGWERCGVCPAGRGAWVGGAARLLSEGPGRGARGRSVHPEAEGSAAERGAADSEGSRYTVTAWRDCHSRQDPRPVVVTDFSCLPSNPLGDLVAETLQTKIVVIRTKSKWLYVALNFTS